MTQDYNLNNIHTLLLRGFSISELRETRFHIPEFRSVHEQLTREISKAEYVDLLLEHAMQTEQIERLLNWAKKVNPARYEMYQPYVGSGTNQFQNADFINTKYNFQNVFNLLTASFSDEELKRFCYLYFRPVNDRISENPNPKEIARQLLDYAERHMQIEELLVRVQEHNPHQYEIYKPYVDYNTAPIPPVLQVSDGGTSNNSGSDDDQETMKTPLENSTPMDSELIPALPAPIAIPSYPPISNNVYICYSRKDLEFVMHLHQELTERGISLWFDKEQIQPGDDWRVAIVEGIRDCKVFLLVLSPDAAASTTIRKETSIAERYRKPILPLIWRDTEIPVALEYQLASIQWINFKETASEENFYELTHVLNRLLEASNFSFASTFARSSETSVPIPPITEEIDLETLANELADPAETSLYFPPSTLPVKSNESKKLSENLDTELQSLRESKI